jgi:hypothetical protein
VLGSLLLLSAFGRAQPLNAIDFEGLQDSNPTATFDHGYVAGWDLQHVHSVTLYAPDGRRMFEVSSFTLPDGTKTGASLSVAIDSDGTSAHVYWAAQGTRSGIAIEDATGVQVRVIETEPYKPSQVCFAPDHTLWIFGDQWRPADLPARDFMTFRHYSRDGKLLGSFVPRSALPGWQGAGLDQVLAPFVGLWRLRAANDRIGAALLVGPSTQAWVELSLDGQLIGQWTFIGTRHEAVMPSAFDSNGILYGVRWIDGKRAGISAFDKSTGGWNPVLSLPNGHLVGADGTRLVYQSGDQLRWVPGLNTELTESLQSVSPDRAITSTR